MKIKFVLKLIHFQIVDGFWMVFKVCTFKSGSTEDGQEAGVSDFRRKRVRDCSGSAAPFDVDGKRGAGEIAESPTRQGNAQKKMNTEGGRPTFLALFADLSQVLITFAETNKVKCNDI